MLSSWTTSGVRFAGCILDLHLHMTEPNGGRPSSLLGACCRIMAPSSVSSEQASRHESLLVRPTTLLLHQIELHGTLLS